MNYIAKVILPALLAAIFAVFGVIFQEDIAAALGKAPITAEIDVGIWGPYPGSNCPPKASIICSNTTNMSDTYVAKIAIINHSGKPIKNLTIANFADYGDFDYIVVSDKTQNISERKGFGVKRFNVGTIEGAQTIKMYAWSNLIFLNSYSMGYFSITSEYGKIPLTIKRHVSESDLNIFGLDSETILIIAIFSLSLIVALVFIVNSYYELYIKSLLIDDDFFLEEKVRFESDIPKEFTASSVPENIVRKISKKDKQRQQ